MCIRDSPYSDDITFWHLSPYLHIVIAPFHICPLHLVIPRDKALPFGFVQFIGCDMIAGNELGIYIEFGYIHVGDFKTQKWGIIMYK